MVKMIKIEIKKDLIKITGHAGYADAGKDIVCASVSSIVYTSVNGIMNIDQDAIKFTDKKDILEIKIINKSKVVNILINSMIDLLEDLENQYPENIKIVKGE